MKKNIGFLITLIIIFSFITAIMIHFNNPNNVKQKDKIEIIATLFPQYDFARQIGGDKVNITLLLPPGTENHTYEPTPQDMVKINNSDLFIYTGEEMEPWANSVISGMKNEINVLDLSTTVDLIKTEEFEEQHMHESDEKHTEDSNHNHSYDPHIWLNPLYAIQMVESIENQLCQIDPENEQYYRNNANEYIKQIQELDTEFEQTINNSKNRKIAFGGAFAYAYFVERYNIEFVTAYQTCGENTEPSTTQVKEVIDYINQNNLPVVFYKEYTNGNIAKTISQSTGAKMLVFNTVHNLSKEEIENGATYISIMRQNLENLKEALK